MIKVTAPAKKDVKLGSAAGVSVFIPAGKTRRVQNFMAPAAAKKGCEISPDDGGDQAASEAVSEAQSAEGQAEADAERLQMLEGGIKQMIERGNPDEFTNQGKPRKAALQGYVDVEFSTNELNAVFDRVVGQA